MFPFIRVVKKGDTNCHLDSFCRILEILLSSKTLYPVLKKEIPTVVSRVAAIRAGSRFFRDRHLSVQSFTMGAFIFLVAIFRNLTLF